MLEPASEQLKSLAEMLPQLGANLAAVEELCKRLRGDVNGAIVGLRALADGGMEDISPESAYAAFENGKKKIVGADAVERIRKEWRGNFLLDQPLRVLRVKTGRKTRAVQLGRDAIHRGIENVLIKGMRNPGRHFGHCSFLAQTGNNRDIGPNVLARYVCTIRKVIGDSGRKPVYLLGTSVDVGFSRTGRGYAFSEEWAYTVIQNV